MKILTKAGKISDSESDAAVVPLFEGDRNLEGDVSSLNRCCEGLLDKMLASGDFKGKCADTAVIYSPQGRIRRLIATGLGKRDELNPEKIRHSYSAAIRRARELNVKDISIPIVRKAKMGVETATESAIEGLILGMYRFTKYQTVPDEPVSDLDRVFVCCDSRQEVKKIKDSVRISEIVSKSVCFARDLAATPSNDMTPTELAARAVEMCKSDSLEIEVLDSGQLSALGMFAFLGVAKGSLEPARFITIRYKGGKQRERPIVIIGKGITFDSGGISIKPADKMDEMKADMAGGAAALAIIKAASELKLPVNLVGLVPATENLPGGSAYKPGDVLRSYSGKTIEVISTDAEGRLILADALSYAARFDPAVIIDLATLTGACVIALGEQVAGLMGNSEKLNADLKAASEKTGELVWELPMWDHYNELIKSPIAELKNTGGRAGGAITAACFLSKFAGDFPWAHLDIAGPAWLSKAGPYSPKGATGFGVRLIVQYLRDLNSDRQ